MDDSEKLTALKKAYAEIILNTAKEAAARIMVSEKRALRFQQELVSTKEESLRMLLRLKQMLDSKDTEAELTSLGQQKKIEELEAQLQEAEDIVRDLREELREVQAELEKGTKSNQLQPLDEQNLEDDIAIQEEISQENRLRTSGSPSSLPCLQLQPLATSSMKNLTSNGTYEGNKCNSPNDLHTDNCYLPNPYFASIVMRSKEPELYKNGCTQRIRAFEKYLLDGKLSFSGQIDDAKNEAFTRGDEAKGLYKTSIHKADSMLDVEEKNQDELKVMHADGNHIKVQAVKSFRQKRRKRATRYKKSKASSYKQGNGLCVIPTHEAENMLGVEEKNPDEVKVMQASRSDIHVQIIKSFCRKRKRAARYVKGRSPSCRSLADQVMETCQASDLSNSKTSPDSVDKNEEAVENISKIIENEGQKDPVSTVVPMLVSDATGVQLGSVDVNQNDMEFVKACSVQNTMNNGTALINKLDMTTQESLSAENSGVHGCRTDVETCDESLVNSDLKASDLNDAVSQTVNNRFLKYTFRRKRKKESLSSPNGDSSLDNSTAKRKTGEKQNGSLEPQNSSLITESSRDSRRLAQVARQLISLSEKKWWQ